MTDNPNRAQILASMGLKKAPELATIKGLVSPAVIESLRAIAQETGTKEEEVVGLAVTDFVKRAERRLARVSKVEGSKVEGSK